MELLFHIILSISAFSALCVKAFGDHFLTPRADIQALQDLGLLYIPRAPHNPGALIWGCPAILHIQRFMGAPVGQALCPVPSRELITRSKRFWMTHCHGKDGLTLSELAGWKPKGTRDSTLPFWLRPSATLLCPWLHKPTSPQPEKIRNTIML